jgi:hypothetical protein
VAGSRGRGSRGRESRSGTADPKAAARSPEFILTPGPRRLLTDSRWRSAAPAKDPALIVGLSREISLSPNSNCRLPCALTDIIFERILFKRLSVYAIPGACADAQCKERNGRLRISVTLPLRAFFFFFFFYSYIFHSSIVVDYYNYLPRGIVSGRRRCGGASGRPS